MIDDSAGNSKDLTLEALRGLAAMVVVAFHCLQSFAPAWTGLYPAFDPTHSRAGEIWYGLVNGTAAVLFFFVLSGFVLTRRYFATGDAMILARGAVKRWPRLAGLVLLVVM